MKLKLLTSCVMATYMAFSPLPALADGFHGFHDGGHYYGHGGHWHGGYGGGNVGGWLLLGVGAFLLTEALISSANEPYYEQPTYYAPPQPVQPSYYSAPTYYAPPAYYAPPPQPVYYQPRPVYYTPHPYYFPSYYNR